MSNDDAKEAVVEKDVEGDGGEGGDGKEIHEEEEEIPHLVPIETPSKKPKLEVSAVN